MQSQAGGVTGSPESVKARKRETFDLWWDGLLEFWPLGNMSEYRTAIYWGGPPEPFGKILLQ